MKRSEIYVINKHGKKTAMPRKEYDSRQKSNNEDDCSEYVFDVDWHLAHGCVTLEQLIEENENRPS